MAAQVYPLHTRETCVSPHSGKAEYFRSSTHSLVHSGEVILSTGWIGRHVNSYSLSPAESFADLCEVKLG